VSTSYIVAQMSGDRLHIGPVFTDYDLMERPAAVEDARRRAVREPGSRWAVLKVDAVVASKPVEWVVEEQPV
jgi:Arc/MetJ family transcription regulator